MEINPYHITKVTYYNTTMGNDVARDAHCEFTMGNHFAMDIHSDVTMVHDIDLSKYQCITMHNDVAINLFLLCSICFIQNYYFIMYCME